MATVASREHRFPYRWLAAIALILFVATLIACNQDGQNGDTQAEGIERLYNAEAVVPPQCYTRTEGRFNACYTCHQTYPFESRPNVMNDGDLQAEYSFSDTALTNHWRNLFVDRSAAIAETPDAEILAYVEEDNYSDLPARLRERDWGGYIPDIENLHLGPEAFDAAGFAKDGSGWVAFNYKPLPSTFWPTNGSTDDVMIRLPEAFRTDTGGQPSRPVYQANLAILEAAIKSLDRIETVPLDEAVLGVDLNGDNAWTVVTEIERPAYYVGAAETVSVAEMLYPEGTEFIHTVRYVGVDDTGEIYVPRRMKELRYMYKLRFMPPELLESVYDREHQEKLEGMLPTYVNLGDQGMDNGFGWLVLGFIEDRQGELRPQTHEEQLFCMGCHTTIGSTIDQTFSFARKITGPAGWGYIDLRGMQDAPNIGEIDGEILTYLKRVGGGSEFRENEEMRERWFNEDGSVDEAAVAAADVYTLITPSRERALALNKAYRVIVREQSYIYGRDATITPAVNVYDVVDPETAPTLPPEYQYAWDIRLDWSAPN